MNKSPREPSSCILFRREEESVHCSRGEVFSESVHESTDAREPYREEEEVECEHGRN